MLKRTAKALAGFGVAAILVTAVAAPSVADDAPKSCNQLAQGNLCVGWYGPQHDLQAWFYNNRGGSNSVILYLMNSSGNILDSTSGTVLYGGTLSIDGLGFCTGTYHSKIKFTSSGTTANSGSITLPGC